jgi:MFS family permease
MASSQAVTSARGGQAETPRTGNRRLIIAIGLLLIITLGYIDRVNMSVAAPHIIDKFGLSKGQFGIVSSAFNWSYALCLVPVGLLADRVGTKVMLPLAIVLWSVGAGATGLAVGFGSLIVARLVMGVGESPVFPAGNLVIREWAPATERGRFSGLLNAGQLAGPAVGAVVAAYLVSATGWRASFYILGAFGVLVGLIWFAIYSKPESSRWLSRGERAHILATRDTLEAETAVPMRLTSLLRTKTMWGLMLTQGCAVYTNYLFLSFLPLYLVETRGFKDLGAGWVTGVTYGVAAVGSLVAAAVSDRSLRGKDVSNGARRGSLIVMMLLGLPLLALPWISSTVLVIVLISWVLVAAISSISLNYALAGDFTVDRASAGSVFGLTTLGGNLFGLLAPIVTGYLVDWTGSYTLPFIVAALLLFVGSAITAMLSRRPLQPARVGAEAA